MQQCSQLLQRQEGSVISPIQDLSRLHLRAVTGSQLHPKLAPTAHTNEPLWQLSPLYPPKAKWPNSLQLSGREGRDDSWGQGSVPTAAGIQCEWLLANYQR